MKSQSARIDALRAELAEVRFLSKRLTEQGSVADGQ